MEVRREKEDNRAPLVGLCDVAYATTASSSSSSASASAYSLGAAARAAHGVGGRRMYSGWSGWISREDSGTLKERDAGKLRPSACLPR